MLDPTKITRGGMGYLTIGGPPCPLGGRRCGGGDGDGKGRPRLLLARKAEKSNEALRQLLNKRGGEREMGSDWDARPGRTFAMGKKKQATRRLHELKPTQREN